MKPKYKKILLAAGIVAVSLLPMVVVAQSSVVDQGLKGSGVGGLFGTNGILNPNQTASQLLVNVVKLILQFVGIIAVLFIIIGGFRYITAQGNDEQAEGGKKTLINAVIGLVIIVLAYVIISVVVNTLTRGSLGFF